MTLTAAQLNEITDTVFIQLYKKIKQLIYTTNARYELKDLLAEIGMDYLFPTMSIPSPKKRILVLGASQVNETDLKDAAGKIGFDPDQIDFVCDYARLSNFDVSRIKDSSRYSHILTGPVPHSMKGVEKIQNLITYIEENSSHFPKLICISDYSNDLHISRSSFIQALETLQQDERTEQIERI